jgi:RNA polymerase sigma factor (sigma-70 family)
MRGSSTTAVGLDTESALMTSYAREGDALAFAGLYARLGPRLRAFFLRSFGSPALADDLLQQTFLNVHRSRASFRGEASVRSWFFSIAGNVRTDELRRRQRQAVAASEPLEAAAGLGGEGDEPGGHEASQVADLVRAALAALPETQRVVIHMHRFEGLSFATIAERLGTSEGAVRVRAFRGYERLRTSLRGLKGGA